MVFSIPENLRFYHETLILPNGIIETCILLCLSNNTDTALGSVIHHLSFFLPSDANLVVKITTCCSFSDVTIDYIVLHHSLVVK